MAGIDRDAGLPRRVPGTAWTWPLSQVAPVRPALPEELRQRMVAAVKAERAEAAAHEQERAAGDRTPGTPRHVRPPQSATIEETGPATNPPASGTNGKRNDAAAAEPAATPGRITGLVPQDDATGGSVGTSHPPASSLVTFRDQAPSVCRRGKSSMSAGSAA
jgi:hypothetical protein